MLNPAQRRIFDDLLDRLVVELPEHIHALLEEVPLIVEDEPSDLLMEELEMDRRTSELCGLHWGVPITQRSVEHGHRLPDRMMLFRGPITRLAGYRQSRRGPANTDSLERQIKITLLHEIGHHFGLDEDDLTRLGYG